MGRWVGGLVRCTTSTNKLSAKSSPQPTPGALALGPLQPKPRAAATTCDPGCLRAFTGHCGLCITEDGPVPPSVKRKHKDHKQGPVERSSSLIEFLSLGDDPIELELTPKRSREV